MNNGPRVSLSQATWFFTLCHQASWSPGGITRKRVKEYLNQKEKKLVEGIENYKIRSFMNWMSTNTVG
jgi:hypothetical protein